MRMDASLLFVSNICSLKIRLLPKHVIRLVQAKVNYL